MIHKDLDYRIHQDERIVKKRIKIAKLFGWSYTKNPGKLRKHNMVCTCGCCSYKHPNGIKKRQASFKEIEKLRVMKDRIDEVI